MSSQIGLVRGYGTDDLVYLVFLSLLRFGASAVHKKYDCFFTGKPPLSIERALFGIAVLVTRKVSPGFPIELLRPIDVGHFSQSLRVDGIRNGVGLNFQYAGSIWMMDADQVTEAIM